MGITINDTIVLDNGLSTNTSYGSFFKSNLTIEKEMQEMNTQGDIIAHLSEIFWVSRQFIKKRLKIVYMLTTKTS